MPEELREAELPYDVQHFDLGMVADPSSVPPRVYQICWSTQAPQPTGLACN